MTDSEILTILKTDLNISVNSRDQYLTQLITAGKEFIKTEGIILTDSLGDGMLVEMYAAYLFRKRNENQDAMPRYLRWALNNRLFSQEK